MKAVRYLLSTAAAAGLAVSASAQPPINMVAPPPPVPPGIAPQPAPPGGQTVWDKLGVSAQQREFCKRKLCKTPFGCLMNTIVSPFSRLSCGLIPPFCPGTPSLAELQDPGPIGAAAKVQQDRAGAGERIKAVKYLSTVDCSYWPEAEEALVGTLRNDRNECVRYEAAVALATGCCCTPKVVVALSNTVGGSTSDGGFMEKSARVRQAAEVALEKCMASCVCADLPPLQLDMGGGAGGGQGGKGEKKDDKQSSMLPTEDSPNAELKAYYKKVSKLPRSVVLNYAQQAMAVSHQYGNQVATPSNRMDLEAAGVPSPTSAAAGPRPANLWDMLSGESKPIATFAYTQVPVRSAPTVAPKTTVPTTTQPRTLSYVLSQTGEPPMKSATPHAPATTTFSASLAYPMRTEAAPSAKVPAAMPVGMTSNLPTSMIAFPSVEPKLAEPKPIRAKPVEMKPVETKPIQAKPVEMKPVETKPIQAKPVETKPVEMKPIQAKPLEVKAVEPKRIEMKLPVTDVKPEVVVQPAGIARVSSVPMAQPTPPVMPAPTYTPAAVFTPAPTQEVLVPAFAPVPTPAPTGMMMAEPIPVRPAIPARR